jgi:hypothetical protein
VSYPLQWLARFPLLALSVGGEDLDGAREHARRLLDPEQQRLPDDIACALREGADGARGTARAQLDCFALAVERARLQRYL